MNSFFVMTVLQFLQHRAWKSCKCKHQNTLVHAHTRTYTERGREGGRGGKEGGGEEGGGREIGGEGRREGARVCSEQERD